MRTRYKRRCEGRLLAGELGDGAHGAEVVDQCLAVGGRDDKSSGGGVVERVEQPAGDAVETGDGIAGEEGIGRPTTASWWRR